MLSFFVFFFFPLMEFSVCEASLVTKIPDLFATNSIENLL